MTLDFGIERMRAKAEHYREMAAINHDDDGVYLYNEMLCRKHAEEYEQIAEWLEEYRDIVHRKECIQMKGADDDHI